MTEFVDPVLFALFAVTTVGCALGMYVTRNVVHEGFLLLGATVGVAGLYLSMGYGFMALVQFLVYAGAVSILLVFSIMITARSREDVTRKRDFSLLSAAIAAAFFGVVAWAVLGHVFPAASMPTAFPSLVDFGKLLYAPEGWVLPFELASLVLLAALVGAVWWSKGGDER